MDMVQRLWSLGGEMRVPWSLGLGLGSGKWKPLQALKGPACLLGRLLVKGRSQCVGQDSFELKELDSAKRLTDKTATTKGDLAAESEWSEGTRSWGAVGLELGQTLTGRGVIRRF